MTKSGDASTTQFSDQLDVCIAFFEANRDQFVNDHHRQFVVVLDNRVVGFYDSDGDAYAAGKAAAGDNAFLLRQCLTAEEEKANAPVFRSRVA